MKTTHRPLWLLLWGALSLPCSASAADAATVWTTTADHRQQLARGELVAPPQRSAPISITVTPDSRHQAVIGFGAAITDASAWLIQQRSQPDARQALLGELFGRQGDGIGLSFTRLTIGASDFSRHHYSLDDPPDGEPDPQLAHFDIAPNRADVIPVARAALAINPDLKIMASPWSAPAWMKSSDNLVTGTLRPQYYDAFARYLLRYVDAYRAEGVPIWALSVQNEPDFEPKDYPGMRLNAPARARLIGDHLGPMLAKRGGQPLLFDWDHNWDKPQEPLAVLRDPKAARYVDAVAWHCYEGEPSAQTPVHDAFPDKDAYMTECSGGTCGTAAQRRHAVGSQAHAGAAAAALGARDTCCGTWRWTRTAARMPAAAPPARAWSPSTAATARSLATMSTTCWPMPAASCGRVRYASIRPIPAPKAWTMSRFATPMARRC